MLRPLFVLLLVLAAAALTACGNKGPLHLPATRPAASVPAVPSTAPAPAVPGSAGAPIGAWH